MGKDTRPIATNLDTERRGKRISWERRDEIVATAQSSTSLMHSISRDGTLETLVDDYVTPEGRVRIRSSYAM